MPVCQSVSLLKRLLAATNRNENKMGNAKGMSLHIGVNSVDPVHYMDPEGKLDLGGCENDARAMFNIAVSRGFEAKILLTRDAVRESVHAEIKKAAKELSPEDIFLITFSGHGGQVYDFSGEEFDFKDETWCLYDVMLIDDELRHLWNKFEEGVRILWISDSCHSMGAFRSLGSGTNLNRNDGLKYRIVPENKLRKIFDEHETLYKKIADMYPGKPKPKASILALGACKASELSLDMGDSGLFTGHLLRIWQNGRFSGKYLDFYKKVRNNVIKGAKIYDRKQTPKYETFGDNKKAINSFLEQEPFTI